MKSIRFPPKNFSSSLHSCLTRLKCINFIHTHWAGNIKTAKFEEGILFISHMFTFRRYIFSHTLPILVSVDDDLFWKNIRTKFTSLIIYHIDRVYFLWKISTHFDITEVLSQYLITLMTYDISAEFVNIFKSWMCWDFVFRCLNKHWVHILLSRNQIDVPNNNYYSRY